MSIVGREREKKLLEKAPLSSEEEWLAARARETLTDIKSGKEKTISWEEMKKRITL